MCVRRNTDVTTGYCACRVKCNDELSGADTVGVCVCV